MKRVFVSIFILCFLSAAYGQAEKPGKSGPPAEGWPKWIAGIKVRFIRLDHGGQGWDDGMSAASGSADANLLQELAKVSGVKVAKKGESHAPRLLAKYSPDGLPPFVYLTGNGRMGRLAKSDLKILRKYCLDGGMLVADAGSPAFHQSFLQAMRMVFPDKKLVDIPDDDQIYQVPYRFANGAPAFWHHGGRRALGIRQGKRWCVFYHPGDMNDAWKSETHTDVTQEMKQSAINLGINLIYHAFSHYRVADNSPAEKESEDAGQ